LPHEGRVRGPQPAPEVDQRGSLAVDQVEFLCVLEDEADRLPIAHGHAAGGRTTANDGGRHDLRRQDGRQRQQKQEYEAGH
jgi:hypothetical protein